MRIDFPLYGLVASWRFPGSQSLGQWLDALPWLVEGGVCAVICATTRDYSVVASAIERRAHAAKSYLTGLGVAEDRLATISYGKERPKVEGKDEASWLVNRRAEFKLQ